MRNLFLLLVLGNLGFAAWYLWVAEPAADVRVIQNPDVSGLSLVGELDESPNEPTRVEIIVPPADELDETLVAEPDVPVARCVGIGPFSELVQFEQALTRLSSLGYTPTQRSEDGDVWLGHWVYLADITTQGQADTVIDDLAENGIVDTAFDPGGGLGDVLSLGVFRELNRAEAVRDQVFGLGYEPEITDRTRPGRLYWADLTLDTGEDPELEPLQPAGRIIRLEQRVCDAPDDTL